MFFEWLILDQYCVLSPKNYTGARTRPKLQEKNLEKFRQHVGAKLRKVSRKFVLKTPLKYRARSRKRLPKFLIFFDISQYLIRQTNTQSFEEIHV